MEAGLVQRKKINPPLILLITFRHLPDWSFVYLCCKLHPFTRARPLPTVENVKFILRRPGGTVWCTLPCSPIDHAQIGNPHQTPCNGTFSWTFVNPLAACNTVKRLVFLLAVIFSYNPTKAWTKRHVVFMLMTPAHRQLPVCLSMSCADCGTYGLLCNCRYATNRDSLVTASTACAESQTAPLFRRKECILFWFIGKEATTPMSRRQIQATRRALTVQKLVSLIVCKQPDVWCQPRASDYVSLRAQASLRYRIAWQTVGACRRRGLSLIGNVHARMKSAEWGSRWKKSANWHFKGVFDVGEDREKGSRRV